MEEKIYFYRYVELLRRSNSPEHYFNHFPWQAKSVIENILQYALDNSLGVNVFTGSFIEVYGEKIVNMLKRVAQSGLKVDIILGDRPLKNNLIVLRDLAEEENIAVRYMKQYDPNLSHLWLSGSAYRFELPHDKFRTTITETSPECPAQFAFHDEDHARKVRRYWREVICSKELIDLRAA